jgi:hypothetical protein
LFVIDGSPQKWVPAGTPPRMYKDAGSALMEVQGFGSRMISQLSPESQKLEYWAVKIATLHSVYVEKLMITTLAKPLVV